MKLTVDDKKSDFVEMDCGSITPVKLDPVPDFYVTGITKTNRITCSLQPNTTINIHLSNVEIQVDSQEVLFVSGGTVHIFFTGTNYLNNTYNNPSPLSASRGGIECAGAKIFISDETIANPSKQLQQSLWKQKTLLQNDRLPKASAETNALYARGGYNSPGIGAGSNYLGGCALVQIELKNGIVHAYGGRSGAGIGGSKGGVTNSSWVEKIVLKGGTIDARGTYGGAGIGGGIGEVGGLSARDSSWVGEILIENAIIQATGSVGSASIGGGYGQEPNSSFVRKIRFIGDQNKVSGFVAASPENEIGGAVIGAGYGEIEHSSQVDSIEILGGTIDTSLLYQPNGYGSGLGGGKGTGDNSAYVTSILIKGGKINVSGGQHASGLGAGQGASATGPSGRVDEIVVKKTIVSIFASCPNPGHAIGNGDSNGIVKNWTSEVEFHCDQTPNTTCNAFGVPSTKPFSKYRNFNMVKVALDLDIVIYQIGLMDSEFV